MSLLYRTAPTELGVSEKTLYHLSLDRVLHYLTPDVKRRAEFADILSRPLASADDIYFRQSILRDFERERALFEELLSLFERFSELCGDHRALSRDKLRLSSSGNDALDPAKNLLQSHALCLKRALLFLHSIHSALSGANLHSEGLNELKNELSAHISEPAFGEMTSLLSSLEGFKTSGALALKLTLKGEKISELELIEPLLVKITDPELKRGAFSKLFRKEEPEYPCERVLSRPYEDSASVLSAGIRSLSDRIKECAEKIFDKFLPILRELRFYELALRYTERMAELELPLCYPEFGDHTEISSLYDIFLAVSRRSALDVVPNDINIPQNCRGILLFGENGSGKTVFLRSLTTAQILAQAGLPIAAASAKMMPRSAIFTQFSEGEKEFEAGNDAGRFEQEVRELAEMVEKSKPGALVLLNETFQTTAYAEGAAGLADILKYFAQNDISFIAVTHLHALDALFAPNEAVRMRTAKGFKVVQSAEQVSAE